MDLGESQYNNLASFSLTTGCFLLNDAHLFKAHLRAEYADKRFGKGSFFTGNTSLVDLEIMINKV